MVGELPVFEGLPKLEQQSPDGIVDGELELELVGVVGEVLAACGFSL